MTPDNLIEAARRLVEEMRHDHDRPEVHSAWDELRKELTAISSRPDAGEAVAKREHWSRQQIVNRVMAAITEHSTSKGKVFAVAAGKAADDILALLEPRFDAHPTAAVAGEGEALARRIAEVVQEDGGCWSACSGCQDSVDGYVSNKDYPYSQIFKCPPGGGCRECGGIGVIWQDGAFLSSYGDALSAESLSQPAADAVGTGGLTEALERLDFLYGKGNLDDDAREVIHFAICAIDCALSTPPRQPDDADARELIGYYASHRPEQADREIANDVLEHSFADGRMLNFRDLVLIATRSRLAATKSPDVDGGAK